MSVDSEYIHCYIGQKSAHLDAIGAVAKSVRRFVSPSAALAFVKEQPPHIVYLDINQYGREGLRFLASLRKALPAASPPVMILQSAENIPGNFEAALFRQSECYVLKPSEIDNRLVNYVEMLLDQHYREREEGVVHPHALELVAKIWRNALSGRIVTDSGDIRIQNGGVVVAGALQGLHGALLSGSLRFEQMPNSGYGDWLGVGEVLYESALKRVRPGYLRERKHLAFVSVQTDRGEDLPLSDEMLALLESGKSSDSIQSRIAGAGLRLSQVEPEIEVLAMLGTHSFVKAVGQSPQRFSSSMDHRLAVDRVLEWRERLLSDCPWKKTGLSPTMNMIQFEQVAHNELQRLEEAAQGHRIAEIKILAHSLAQQVESSIPTLKELVSVYRFFGLPEGLDQPEEYSFIQGYLALENRSTLDAYRFFLMSISANPGSLRNQIFCAWAAFLVDGSQAARRYNEIQIASAGRPGYFPAYRFLAAIDWHMDNQSKAIDSLQKMAADSDELSSNILSRIQKTAVIPTHHIHRH